MPVTQPPPVSAGSFSDALLTPWSANALGPKMTGMPAAASTTFGVANLAIFIPFFLNRTELVQHLACQNGSTVAGNIDIGIYDAAFARIISTGSVLQAGASTVQAIDVADTDLLAGQYWLALSHSNATATQWGIAATGSMPRSWGMRTQTVFPLPVNAAPIPAGLGIALPHPMVAFRLQAP